MTSPNSPDAPAESPAEVTPAKPPVFGPVAVLLAAAVAAGIVAAVVWRLVVRLPAYQVQADGSATMTERALTEFFAADAWYVLLGGVVGLALGVACWRRLKGVGWPAAFAAAGLGLLAGLVCWQLGQLLGGVSFDERLAAAKPGDVVPISLTLRSPSALALWAFAAVTPLLLGSALGPDEDAPPRQPRRRREQPRTDEDEVVDDRGVVRTEEGSVAP